MTQLLSVTYALYAEKTKLLCGNAITITNGKTINANYQGGNAITITGNTIAANYQGGNAIAITGNTIAANYQAGNAITITGNTIAGNYQAGPGINITGNTISATAGNSWLLNGNSGATASNFLGTIDNQNLRFRTFNQERMVLDVNGNAGIGTPTPNYLLSLEGQFNGAGAFDKRMLISLNNTSNSNDALTAIRLEANGGITDPTNFGMLLMVSPGYNITPAFANSLNVQTYSRGGVNIIASQYGVNNATYGKIRFFIG